VWCAIKVCVDLVGSDFSSCKSEGLVVVVINNRLGLCAVVEETQ